MTVIDFLDLQQQRLDAEELKDEAQECASLDKLWNEGGWLTRRFVNIAVRLYAFNILNERTDHHFQYLWDCYGSAAIEWAKSILPNEEDQREGEEHD